MKTISVTELRQNPTQALAAVEAGETYVITKHRHPIAQLIPIPTELTVVPSRRSGPTRLTERVLDRVYTDAEIDALLADMAEDR
ncbi:type II toxin-antitoxin system prevent-host-death family antitoxin [Galbitalea sp. SE-J8]|uniref:type II toxin-antitoxin system Phd/YefM family antitoxin n=1 Tax=Galbitalea sp. SE-J8 TaxID=3054952 RepID=UPI00259CDBCE|nr:type II toxin-antitoxin system prevent-host-death family antitoxin [Galbitalea sp. SE-J8]MDM4764270.1 type II toxin-antitoxin system prevent-host-death family antitoxin [Galbitalea sp. SE-J8]